MISCVAWMSILFSFLVRGTILIIPIHLTNRHAKRGRHKPFNVMQVETKVVTIMNYQFLLIVIFAMNWLLQKNLPSAKWSENKVYKNMKNKRI